MGSCPIRRGSRGRATPFLCSTAEAVGALAASRGRVLALRAAGRTNPLTRPPHPASAARRPKAGGGLEGNFSKLVVGQGRRPRRGRWVCGRRLGSRWASPVGGRWAGAACPRAVHQGCPRAERSEPAGGRRPSSTYPRARVSRGRSPLGKGEARAVQGRRPPQPPQAVTTSHREV